MQKILITCDFCGKSIENSSADIDFVAFKDESKRIKTGDICESCKDKIDSFLKNLKRENLLDKEFTKKEAIQMMQKGYKMTHRCFDEKEWATIKSDGFISFEDGYKIALEQFGSNKEYETGWKIFKN